VKGRTLQVKTDAVEKLEIVPGRYRLLAIARGWELEWADPKVLGVFEKKSIPIVIHANDSLKETVEVQSR
jgi:hypothetical protein